MCNSHLLTERIVCLGTAIDPGVANTLIAQLLHLEAQGISARRRAAWAPASG